MLSHLSSNYDGFVGLTNTNLRMAQSAMSELGLQLNIRETVYVLRDPDTSLRGFFRRKRERHCQGTKPRLRDQYQLLARNGATALDFDPG